MPGFRLHMLLRDAGYTKDGKCDCDDMIDKMNRWGIDGCREHRAEIVDHLVKASKATSTELPFGLDLADMLGALVDEAIRQSEISQNSRGNDRSYTETIPLNSDT